MYKTKEEVKKSSREVKYSEDHASLVMWSLQRRNKSQSLEKYDIDLMGILIVKMVE